MRAAPQGSLTVLSVHSGLLTSFLLRRRRRGATMLLTVLIVFASATIAALVVQVTVGAAGSQQRRLASSTASSTVEELLSRVTNLVRSDPGRIYVEVLPGETPRICTLDQTNHPDPIGAGEVWPSTCGNQWEYTAAGENGAQIHPPTPTNPEMRIEVFARSGEEKVGKRIVMLPGGRQRPTLYFGEDTNLEDLGFNLTLGGILYSAGTLDTGSVSIPTTMVLAAENGFPTVPVTGTLLTLDGMPGGENPVDIRDTYPAALPASGMAAAAAALKTVACPGETPVNSAGHLSSLCIEEGRNLTDRTGAAVTVPTRTEKPYLLLLPVTGNGWELYARSTKPAAWPGETSGWGEPIGTFETPLTGIIYTDRTSVIGNCDPDGGVCTARGDDGQPGHTAEQSVTFLVGTPGNPQTAIIGAPLRRGSGVTGIVSGSLLVPAGATTSGADLDVEAFIALTGTPGEALLRDDTTDPDGARSVLTIHGSLLLTRNDIELGAFTTRNLVIDAEGNRTPPWMPGPGGGYVVDRFEELSQSELGALLGA